MTLSPKIVRYLLSVSSRYSFKAIERYLMLFECRDIGENFYAGKAYSRPKILTFQGA
jgi:hypothetical protein